MDRINKSIYDNKPDDIISPRGFNGSRAKRTLSKLIPKKSIDEKLDSAVLKKADYHYDIPENWEWVILGETSKIKRGASPRPIKAFVTEAEDGVNWIKIGDTDTGKYVTSVKEKITPEGSKKSVFVDQGTLLLSNSMSFGRPYILNVSGCIHDGWLAITPKQCFDKEFLYYSLLNSEWYFQEVAVGTAVRNLNADRVAKTPVVLPPLAEQHRIVDRIESLFAKLDEVKEKLEAVVDSYEIRKAAILHKAFSGELTKSWRRIHTDDKNTWQTKKLNEVCESICDGDHQPPPKSQDGIPFIVISNITTGELDLTTTRSVPESYYKQLSDKRKPAKGDILYSIVGSYGIPCIVETDKSFCFQRHIALLKPNNIETEFLYLALQTKEFFYKATEIATGTAQLTIPIKGLRELTIKVPCMEEQKEIVYKTNILLNNIKRTVGIAQTSIAKIDLLKKSILARAFRGELGTNRPEEESSIELLKEILAEN